MVKPIDIEPTVELAGSWGSVGGVTLGGCAESLGSCEGAKVSLVSPAWTGPPAGISRAEVVVAVAGLWESGTGVGGDESGCWATVTAWGEGGALVDGFGVLPPEDSGATKDARKRSSRVVLRKPASVVLFAVDEGPGLADRGRGFCRAGLAFRWVVIDLRFARALSADCAE